MENEAIMWCEKHQQDLSKCDSSKCFNMQDKPDFVVTKKDLNHAKFSNMRPNLFILRCSKGLSSREADDNILQTKIKRWEQLEQRIGYPTLDELMLISEFFNIPINDILYKKYKIIFE